MLPKENRLKKEKDFKLILRNGKKFKEDFLVLKLIRNNFKFSRFGFLIGKKISKKSIIRNKLKRRLVELIKVNLSKIKKKFDVLLIPQPGLENKDFWELEEIVKKILNKSKIMEYESL